MLVRRKRFGCSFWVALVAVLVNPLFWRLLGFLFGLLVQFIGSHLLFLHTLS
jgi:hypothetical protein